MQYNEKRALRMICDLSCDLFVANNNAETTIKIAAVNIARKIILKKPNFPSFRRPSFAENENTN